MSEALFDQAHETFRNELASVDREGRRRWVYARKPSGRFYRARTVLSWFLLAFLFLAPFVKLNGQPLVLLNVLERRFVLFGLVFWPQDFYLVVLLALLGLVTLAWSTTAVGRVWCGWLCPQTVFMEMLFRKIEYAIDGSAAEQLRRDRAKATVATIARRVVKQAIFFGLSFVIANVFLAYVIGAEALWQIITDPPSAHLVGLVAITIFSLLFYGVFARFREQACILACPYGRMMSALIDTHTITVTYDRSRGEPRGKLIRSGISSTDPARRGDCIDCGQCVTVCPTGIDIRNGLQLECVNCTACIDACDSVMDRINRPRGLIRLTSHEAIRSGRDSWLTGRVKAYGGVWALLAAGVTVLFVMRADLDVVILRQPGTLYAEVNGSDVANFYNVQVINRTARPHSLEYIAIGLPGATVTALGQIDRAVPHGLIESRLLLQVPKQSLSGATTPMAFEIRADGKLLETISSTFVGPGK